MRTAPPSLLPLLAGALATFLALPCWGQNLSREQIEKARQHYLAAVEAEGKGNYDTAIKEFQTAYDLTRDPKIFYQIARANELAGRIDPAITYYRRYMAEAEMSAQGRSDVATKIEELEAMREATPSPMTRPSETPPTPLSPTGTPEPHEAPGVTRIPSANDGEVPPEAPPTFLGGGQTWQTTAGWVSIGLTAAFLVTGGVLATSSSSREEDIQRLIDFRDPTTQLPTVYRGVVKDEYLESIDEGKQFNKYAIIAFIGAGVAAGAAVTFFLLDEYSEPAHNEPATALVPTVGPDQAGVAVMWTF